MESRQREQNVNSQIRFAKEAVRKLRDAAVRNNSIYLYGATGYGKTSIAASVFDPACALWIDCDDTADNILRQLTACSPSRYTVLDDLHCVEDTALQRKIVQLIGRGGCPMVLIGRAPLPAWLSGLELQSGLTVIPEDDLWVTDGELTELCTSLGLRLPPQRIRELLDINEGNIMALGLFLRRIQQGTADGKPLEADMRKDFKAYLDEEVVSHWSRDIQDFLTQVCVVDSFTLPMAEYITGNDGCALLLSRAEKVGNILSCTNGVWRMRQVLLETMRERALRTLGRKGYNRLLSRAGEFLEQDGHTVRALAIYRQCSQEDRIHNILVQEARKHPGVGNYWALRQYYQALPPAEIEKEPTLMAAESVLYSVLMNTEKSEYWYSRLKQYAGAAEGTARNEAVGEIAYLDVVLPHRGSGNMVRILKSIPGLMRSSGDVLRPVSLTNNQPSLMNGGKDFCEWSKTDIFLANTLGPIVEKILGKTGVGLVQTALGESAYEKGEDRFRVLTYLTQGQNQSENNGIAEMTWVAIALQAKLALCAGDMEYAQKLAEGMLQGLDPEHQPQLYEAVTAFSCWLRLYRNETGTIRRWLETAPDETVEFCTLNRYFYMVKIYCYAALGKHTEALGLVSRMMAYAAYAQRTYIRLECGLLQAIVLRRMGDTWKEGFLQTLSAISQYHFVPIVSEKGAAVLPLLTEAKTAFCQRCPGAAGWFSQVLDKTTHMARLYPNYLKGTGIDISAFSDTALEVLRLQAAGYTTKEIAQQLHITQRTVKYHAGENYRKLDARNLVDAVQIAQSLHIL